MVTILAGILTFGQHTAPTPTQTAATTTVARVTTRKANTMGKVFVVMYHHIREGKNLMFRSPEKFRKDLERYYDMGFRPVTVSEYVGNRMNLAPGASPIVITFDDAHPNQFTILKDGTIDPKCAVGVWLDFAKTHPDFPVKGTFYVLPVLWGQHSLIQKKIDMLRGWGSEIGNHTYDHPFLNRLSDDKVKYEIARMNDLLVKYGIPPNMPFCPPYGEYPKNRQLVKSFEYKGKTYRHSSASMAWDSPAASPNDTKHFDRYHFERIGANGGEMGIDWWLNRLKNGKVQVYVAP
ncbi:MAG: polysaccharide deacetylase family protein [Armatimonadetes bacterium]|nr:polysaccharide deacetylase family protein [Armatimonadota bacterium]MBS1703922.1 polysaccharide deacetylase family protein [Armatimonadota bacterium]